MQLRSAILLAAGLAALSACGGGAEENTASNVVVEDLNVTDDLGDPNLLGEDLGNAGTDLNTADANAANAVDANATGNTQ